jgi:hypothetical protein
MKKIKFYGKKSLINSNSLDYGLETASDVIDFFKNVYFKDDEDSKSKIGIHFLRFDLFFSQFQTKKCLLFSKQQLPYLLKSVCYKMI